MRRDKAATRILLILSFIHVAAAAPAITRQRSLEVTKDVTPTSKKRANADATLPRLPSQDDTSPGPGVPPSQDDPLVESGTPQLHYDRPPTPGTSSSQDDTLPEDLHSWSEDEVPQLHDMPWQHANEHPPEATLQGDSSAVPPPRDEWHTPVHMPQDDPPGAPLSPNQHANLVSPEETVYDGSTWSTTSEPPPLLDDNHWWRLANLASFGSALHVGSPVTSSTTSEAPYWGQQLQNGWHHDGALSSSDSHSEAPMTVDSHEGSDSSSRSSGDIPIIGGLHRSSTFGPEDLIHLIPVDSEAPQPLELEASPSAPETHTFLNDALKQKLKVIAGVGAVAGVLAGGALGVDKLIKGHSHRSQPAGRDLASSGIVGRDTSMHPRPLKTPVSRARANLRNEDLRLLSILMRRALERLD